MSMTGAPSSVASQTPDHDADARTFDGPSAAMLAAIVFALLGILGFIPGVTKHVAFQAGERFSGPESHAMLFGLFQTSVMANLLFLVFGIVGAVSSFFVLTARLYFFVGAVVFGFFCIYGFSIDRSGPANFLPMNSADNWLHLAIAVVMLVVGLALSAPRRH